MISFISIVLVVVVIACVIWLLIIQRNHTKQKKTKNEILVQFLTCIISATIPTIVSLCILLRDNNRDQMQQDMVKYAEIRRVSIDLIAEVEPNIIVEVVNLYKNNETTEARDKLSTKYNRLNYVLASFNLCAEAYYTIGDENRDDFINLCNGLSLKFADALDIVQYLISVPDEGVSYYPILLESDMRKNGYNLTLLDMIAFPSQRLTRDEYGQFVANSATILLEELGHSNTKKSIQKQLLLEAGVYLRNDLIRINK